MAYEYDPDNRFGYKDQLDAQNSEKIIKGSEFDDEFKKIAAESQSLSQSTEDLSDKLDAEIADRIDGDEVLQDQIDALVDGSIDIKPDQIEGLPEYLDENYVNKVKTEDQEIVSKFTFRGEKPTENGIGNRFVVDPTSRAARFYSGADQISSDGSNPWDVQVDGNLVAYHNFFPPRSMTYTPSGMSAATEVYITFRNADDPDNPVNPDPQPAKWIVKPNLEVEGNIYMDGIDLKEALAELANNGGGSSVVVSDDPPADPEEGDLWYSSKVGDEGLYCWDGEAWFEAVGANGADGADGNIADGTEQGVVATWDSTANSNAGQWTPDSSLTIDATGNATFSGTVSASGALIDRGIYRPGPTGSGIRLSNQNQILPADGAGNQQNDLISIGQNSYRFKDGYFSGTVTALKFSGDGSLLTNLPVQSVDAYTKTESDGRYAKYSDSPVELPGEGVYLYPVTGNYFSFGSQTFAEESTGSTIRQNGMTYDSTMQGGNWVRFSGYGGCAFYSGKNRKLRITNSGSYFDDNVTAPNITARGHIIQDGSPVIDAKGLIKTLSTLRQATMDETQDIRESLRSAIDELIDGFEQEIATMPVPEATTQEIPE